MLGGSLKCLWVVPHVMRNPPLLVCLRRKEMTTLRVPRLPMCGRLMSACEGNEWPSFERLSCRGVVTKERLGCQ